MDKYFSMRAHEDWDQNEKDIPYWEQVFTHFASLEGSVVDYYGADEASHEFKVDDIIFRVMEDPDDGYRSHLGVIEYGEQSNAIFFRNPLARVRIESFERERVSEEGWDSGAGTGYRFIDVEDGYVWLEFGTDNTDDYYPYFVFKHSPKPTPLVEP
ncbi:MAG TPA: hypothetical protein EYF95_03490, partial [Flavobacteriales bacterium]|nr:hypothetical protein [Flavobacteriales bacterium]